MLLDKERDRKDELARAEPSGKEDPRVIRTRRLLQQAFRELMLEKSFQAITVQDIAERATVNRVTFYAHFADKYALLETTSREMIRRQLRGELPEGTPFSPENVARLILTLCEFLAEVRRHCPPPHGQLEPVMEKQIKAEIYEILHGWLAEMPADPSKRYPRPEQAAMIASWAIYGAAVQWVQQARQEPAGEYVQQVLPLILGSLQPSAVFPSP